MRILRTSIPLTLGLCVAFAVVALGGKQQGATSPTSTAIGQPPGEMAQLAANLPVAFERNDGQFDPRVQFAARGKGYNVFISGSTAVFDLASADGDPARAAFTMTLANVSPTPVASGQDALPGRVNYFSGADPSEWTRGVPTFARVSMAGVYPGIDLSYYGSGRDIEYDFRVAALADARSIGLRFEGVTAMRIDEAGDLVFDTPVGQVRQAPPFAYQDYDDGRREVRAAYALAADGSVAFDLGPYDAGHELVIDPVLSYSTYLGGPGPNSGDDVGNAIAVDAAGNAYIAGQAVSTTFPTTIGAYDTALAGIADAFVTKLNPTGTAILYSTYLGGNSRSEGRGIAVDTAGNAYVTGKTDDDDNSFPTTPGAFQPTWGGAFVTKIDPTGASLVYSTYLGGGPGGDTRANDIVVDADGYAYIAGYTGRNNYPTTAGAYQTTFTCCTAAFVTKMNLDGTALVYSTMFSGNDFAITKGNGIAVDGAGNAWISGETDGGGLPVTGGAFQPSHGGATFEGFVTKFNAAGTALLFSSYLGGNGDDQAFGIDIDPDGNVYVAGQTSSGNFLVTPGAFDITNNASADAFVTKLTATGSPVYSTYLGGTQGDSGAAIAVDAYGHAFVAGSAGNFFPSTFMGYSGGGDGFAAMLSRNGGNLAWAAYLGGDQGDLAAGIATGPAGSAYVTGRAGSGNFPTTPGVVQPTQAASTDAFVTRILCTGDQDCDGFLDPPATAHDGPANTNTAVDNCSTFWNPAQLNSDANFFDNSPPYVVATDDKTDPNSDPLGDACDSDDDNDGIPDATETNLAALQTLCPTTTGVTDPLNLDTDNDHVADYAECLLGSDPVNFASKPVLPPPAQDPDNDKLSSAVEAILGTNPNVFDTDNDGVNDGIEVKGWRTNPLVADSDGDGVRDRCEIGSINGDTVVNPGDQALLAAEMIRAVPATSKLSHFDLNKDGAYNPGDQAYQASMIGSGKCP